MINVQSPPSGDDEEEEDADDGDAGFSLAAAAAPAPLRTTQRSLGMGGMPRHRAGPAPVVVGMEVSESLVEDEYVASSVDLGSLGALPPAEKLDMLVSLQGFSGEWKWEEQVLRLLGLEMRVAVPLGLGRQSDVLATAMVVVFLEERLGELKDEWEMLVDKARGWLDGKIGGKTVEEYCEAVKGFWTGQGVL
jgi:hypothetical protein